MLIFWCHVGVSIAQIPLIRIAQTTKQHNRSHSTGNFNKPDAYSNLTLKTSQGSLWKQSYQDVRVAGVDQIVSRSSQQYHHWQVITSATSDLGVQVKLVNNSWFELIKKKHDNKQYNNRTDKVISSVLQRTNRANIEPSAVGVHETKVDLRYAKAVLLLLHDGAQPSSLTSLCFTSPQAM